MAASMLTKAVIGGLCEHIASGRSARSWCEADPTRPKIAAVSNWLMQAIEAETVEAGKRTERERLLIEFADRHEVARECQRIVWEDEMMDIADDARNDWMERKSKDGEVEMVVDRDHIRRSEVRIQTRRWNLERSMGVYRQAKARRDERRTMMLGPAPGQQVVIEVHVSGQRPCPPEPSQQELNDHDDD